MTVISLEIRKGQNERLDRYLAVDCKEVEVYRNGTFFYGTLATLETGQIVVIDGSSKNRHVLARGDLVGEPGEIRKMLLKYNV